MCGLGGAEGVCCPGRRAWLCVLLRYYAVSCSYCDSNSKGWGVQRVAAALAGVQAQVAKEQVVWRAGPLVMAPLVQSSLAASQVTGVELYSVPLFP